MSSYSISFLYQLAPKLGIELADLGAKEYLYTGKAINLYYCQNVSDILHEIAHYVIAQPSERVKVNFGWQYPPSGPTSEINNKIKRQSSFKDEEKVASLLGILGEKALSLKWKKTAKDHNWNDWCDFWKQAWGLRRINLLDKNYYPNFLYGKLDWKRI